MRRSLRLIALFTGIFILLSPLAGYALTLEEGLKIVTEKGRDVAIAHSDEEVAKGAVSLARSPWLPQLDLYGRETWLYYQPAIKIGPTGIPVETSFTPERTSDMMSAGARRHDSRRSERESLAFTRANPRPRPPVLRPH